jgi:membrane-associated phospholipid phosphatase
MALFRIRPARGDIEIAEWISDHSASQVEQLAKILTWGADEHVVCALAAAWWLYCRGRGAQDRADGNHILLTAVAASLLPHLLKSVFDQKRPDRLTIGGHLHGVPFSGTPNDAFPSGHAIHVCAMAPPATVLPLAKRNLVWSLGAGLVATRVVLLAHWTSDVIAGLAIGAAVERLLRRWTGFGRRRRCEEPKLGEGLAIKSSHDRADRAPSA